MNTINYIYSLGIWTVRAGRERDFIREWENFAAWTANNQPGAVEAKLLQDLANPRKFISFGPFKSQEAINAWRETSEFKGFVDKVRVMCESFLPHTMKPVATAGKLEYAK